MGKRFEQTIHKENIQMATKHQYYRKMQIKTTMSYQYTSTAMAKVKMNKQGETWQYYLLVRVWCNLHTLQVDM